MHSHRPVAELIYAITLIVLVVVVVVVAVDFDCCFLRAAADARRLLRLLPLTTTEEYQPLGQQQPVWIEAKAQFLTVGGGCRYRPGIHPCLPDAEVSSFDSDHEVTVLAEELRAIAGSAFVVLQKKRWCV